MGRLLPKYRGAAPINWALLNGDEVAGITVIHMTPRLDGGPMICKRSLDVGVSEDAVALEERLSNLGVEAVIEAIELLTDWDGESTLGEPQEKELVTKAPRLSKSDGAIDWNKPAKQLFDQVRALKPWPGTFSNLLRAGKDPMRVIIHEVTKCAAMDGLADPGAGQSTEQGIVVACGEDALCIKRIQPAGKRVMDSEEFVRGYGASLQFG